MRCASPSPSSPLQSNVTRSPGLSSTTPSRSGPMRSLGPGGPAGSPPGDPRGRPRRARGGSSRRARRACRASSSTARRPCRPRPCEPRISGSREAGPIVATIFVRRISRTVSTALVTCACLVAPARCGAGSAACRMCAQALCGLPDVAPGPPRPARSGCMYIGEVLGAVLAQHVANPGALSGARDAKACEQLALALDRCARDLPAHR